MNYLRTAILLAGLTALFMGIGYLIGGASGAVIALLVAAGMNLASYWNADKLVLAMHDAHEVDETTAPELVHLVQDLARRAGLPMPRIYLMDNPQPNAFATGRNPEHAAVAVTTGLLQMLSREEIAGVIAHELAHDDLSHVAKAQTLGAGVNIGMVILDQIFPGAGAIAPIAGQLVMNKYTQSEEYAADRHGMEILQKAGLPPSTMADTLTWLMQTDGASSGGFFSTHPATGDRIEALRKAQ